MKKRLIFILLVLIIVIAAVLWWREHRAYDGPVQTVQASAEQIERGRYLALAADCSGCHNSPDGAVMAGGFGISTPFGLINATNITPAPDVGIGRWTADDFYIALTDGVTPSGRHLYPAMPYVSYNNITRQDSDDLYAYFMNLPVVNQPAPENDLPFPFNQRMAMIGWNILFLSSDPLPVSSSGQSEQWQRGRYLTNVLGHCAECHTQRGLLGQMEKKVIMQGGNIGRILASDITPEGLVQRGWTEKDLQQFLATGVAPQGSAFSEMYTVVNRSTQYMTEEDLRAMVTYLLGDIPPKVSVIERMATENAVGGQSYLNVCAGCHGFKGEGKPNVAINMADNSTVRTVDATNLIAVILDGIPSQDFTNNQSMQSMPGFATRMSDQEIAELVNDLRVRWGSLPADVTAEQVGKLRTTP